MSIINDRDKSDIGNHSNAANDFPIIPVETLHATSLLFACNVSTGNFLRYFPVCSYGKVCSCIGGHFRFNLAYA